tara:strand:+ start:607 stop:729 length:123 start_codon:yes stop_codon:yes gene_type:complete
MNAPAISLGIQLATHVKESKKVLAVLLKISQIKIIPLVFN